MIRILKAQIRRRDGRWEVVVTPPDGVKNIYGTQNGTFAEACRTAMPPSWWDEERHRQAL